MANFSVPSSASTYSSSLDTFLGVDYNDAVIDNRRSPNMVNFINNNGFLETRNGHKILGHIGTGKIHGVWNVDANDDIFIIHCGTTIYEVDKTFTTIVTLETGAPNVHSTGIYLDDKLLLLLGDRARVYGKFDVNWELKYIDEIGYIPTTQVSRDPNGVKSTLYEAVNQVTKYRINSFLSDGTSTVYQLDGTSWANETPVITQLNSSGTWVVVTAFTYEYTTGKVTFTTAPVVSPSDGVDNIKIKFKSNDGVNYINKCTIATVFGYSGNNNRVFVCGNSDYANVEWHSESDNITYYPDDSFAKIGISPITGYSRMSDGLLAIQKQISDTDCTVYYRTSNSQNYKEVFPLTDGAKNIGCLTNNCNHNLINDPMFLSEQGVFSMSVSSSSTVNQKYAEDRGYYIKNKLLSETNLQNAVGTVNNGKYYIAVNGHVYIADSRMTSSARNSNSSYQYEWFYWDNMPVSTWFNWNNKLYFGDNDGNIRAFGTDYLDDVYTAGVITTTPVECYWESAPMMLNSPIYAKTVTRVLAHHSPVGNSKLTIGYIDEEGKHPVNTSEYTSASYGIPKVIQEKEKIRKFMYLKLYVENDVNKRCSFNALSIEYRLAGKYRGD